MKPLEPGFEKILFIRATLKGKLMGATTVTAHEH